MLEQYFKAQYALVQARPGIAGPFLEGFAGHLETEGFTPSTVGRYLRAAAHLGAWMEAEGIALPDLDDTVIGGFIQHFLEFKGHGYLLKVRVVAIGDFGLDLDPTVEDARDDRLPVSELEPPSSSEEVQDRLSARRSWAATRASSADSSTSCMASAARRVA
jgi:hypothetical protein